MTTLAAPRRRRLVALLITSNDWVSVPCMRSPAGDGEQSMATGGTESEVERQDRKQRERRYRERVEALTDQAAGMERSGPTRNEAAYRAHMASGSYLELDQALGMLKQHQPFSCWVLDRVYVQQLPAGVEEDVLAMALGLLSDLLPMLLRVPVQDLDPPVDRVDRDRRISAWAAAGRSTRWIAARVDLSHVRVSKIIHEQAAAQRAAA
jgi:hypothetical protein